MSGSRRDHSETHALNWVFRAHIDLAREIWLQWHGPENEGLDSAYRADGRPRTTGVSLGVLAAHLTAKSLNPFLVECPENHDLSLDIAAPPLLTMTATDEDLRQIWNWNAEVPRAINEFCIQDLIQKAASRDPNKKAVCAWDGDLTYHELDHSSDQLAHMLRSKGVRPASGTIVILCFQKSKWTSIAMLAVMKVGGISASLDVAQPIERLSDIAEQTETKVVICSSATRKIAAAVASTASIVEIDMELARSTALDIEFDRSSPEQTLFVTFTSGSTGRPKGSRISHANVCAAVHYQGRKLGFSETARVLDFAPYSFDVAWSNMLHTFCAGATLCIPSTDEMLDDLALSIDKYKATLLNVTPTILRTLDWQPSSLTDVLLSGESPDPMLLSKWADKVRLKNTYGPSECTFKSTFSEVTPGTVTQSTNIGTAVGAVTWVVHPGMQEQLVPIGDVGELWLEGPLVGQGYLEESGTISSTFVQDPAWLLQGAGDQTGRRGRLYRTGDLVRYATDGSLIFMGRKDQQVKIRGCRVELRDVEHHLRKSLPDDSNAEVAVEAIKLKDSNCASLVAFMTVERTVVDENKLSGLLPRYMIPSAYIHLPQGLPQTPTGKTDRGRLRDIGASWTIKHSTKNQGPVTKPEQMTPMEERIRELWAVTLGVPTDRIGIEDNFFERGGDSVRAIRLVAAAREQCLAFSVADVFRWPTLQDLSKAVREEPHRENQSVEPFSLMKLEDKLDTRNTAAMECGIESSQIEDIIPCTPLQAGLFALTLQRPGSYVSTRTYKLRDAVDLSRFRAAWEKIVQHEPILRTRIASLRGKQFVQVVVRGSLEWSERARRDPRQESVVSIAMTLGTPLAHFAIVEDDSTGENSFVWTMHHALHDGWSRSLLLQAVEIAYAGDAVRSSPPFPLFVKHILSLDEEKAMLAWRDELQGMMAPTFPALPSQEYQPMASAVLKLDIDGIEWPAGNITPPTLVQAALAILIQGYTNSSDIAMGTVVAGRDAPADGIERMTGPTVTTVPLAMSLKDCDKVVNLLDQIQGRNFAMKPFEQIGLTRLRTASAEAEQACKFQTLVVVHPIDAADGRPSPLFEGVTNETLEDDGVDTYALMLSLQLKNGGMQTTAKYDPAVLKPSAVQRILKHFEHLLSQLFSPVTWEKSISDISAVSSDDLRDIQRWNSHVPRPVPACVHTLLAEVFERQPDVPAVHAWDGDLTYAQLRTLSERLAHNLVASIGAIPGRNIAICFEKSMWTSVAILGAVKAGFATIAFDVTQPEQRLRTIVEQSRPSAIIASPACMELCKRLATISRPISLEALLSVQPPSCELPCVQPTDSLFIVFTSGSTGIPKGIVVTHQNFSSALIHQNKQLGFGPGTRAFDFASYAFDAAYYNLLHTLYGGGCLCVPSESERQSDLSGSICRLRASFANLTPQVAGILDVRALEQLHLLELSGETADSGLVVRLRQHTAVRFAYGPAECSVLSTVSLEDAPTSNIGRGLGVCGWVVDCRNPTLLAPVGCVGELWLEGPLVCQGYLGDVEKTAAVFVDSPSWLQQVGQRDGRTYRTGDLVRYDVDGSLTFIGRSGTQIKIRGQRVDLDEVAYHVQQCLECSSTADVEAVTVIAEVASPLEGRNPLLVAFLTIDSPKSISMDEMAEAIREMTRDVQSRMSIAVPSSMIPSLFIPLRQVPLTASGKIDRQQLRKTIQNTRAECLDLSLLPRVTQLSNTERNMQATWSRILKVDKSRIDQDSSFWAFGDSITAMSLIGAIREEYGVDLGLPVLIRRTATLKDISRKVETAKSGTGMEHSSSASSHADLVELTAKLKLLATIGEGSSRQPSTRHRPIAFLTGATGYLGTQILRDLIKSRHFQTIVVLVRAMNGLNKVRQTAQLAGWWSESAAHCIEVWKGDLSKPLLGLTVAQWNRLSGRSTSPDMINTIIHNGAVVHWSADYEGLKAVNVESTFQLLQASLQSPCLRRFVYISGGRDGDPRQDPVMAKQDDRASGYVQTKAVSERLVVTVAEHGQQLPGKFAVVKPGLIIGGAESGTPNVDDFLWRVVRSSIKLGSFACETDDSWLFIAEVATVSECILQQVVAHEAETYTSVNEGISLISFWDAVQTALGNRLVAVDMVDWIKLMRAEIERDDEAHPLWPVQNFLGRLGMDQTVRAPILQERTRRLELAIARNVQCLMRMVSSDECSSEGCPTSKDVMTRSRLTLAPDVRASGMAP